MATRAVATPWPRRTFVVFMVLAAATFAVGSADIGAAAFVAADLVTLAAVAMRARASEPGSGDPWRLMLVAFGVYSLSAVPWYVFPASGHPLPLPSPVDGGFLLSYLLFGLVLQRLASGYVGQDRRAWLEIVIVSLGVSAPVWELRLRRTSPDGISAAADVTLVAYPAALLVLFAFALRLALLADRREPRQLLVLGWIGGELVGDLYLNLAGTAGTLSLRSPWLLFYVLSWLCVGLAALHPRWTPSRVLRPAREAGARTRLVWLGSSALLPVFSLAAVVRYQHRLPLYAVGVAGVVVLLLLVRVSSLVVDLGEQQRARLDLERLADQLRHQSLHDPLTGIANRTLLHDRIEHALRQRARRSRAGVAVLWLDLDGFKAVNDALGHDVGDQLLLEVARRLVVVARAGGTVGRLGGDEFAVVLADVDAGEAVGLAERISEALAVPADLGAVRVAPVASIGIAVSDGSQDRITLLKQADVAMFGAKTRTPGSYQLFSAELHATALQRQELSSAVKGAAARDELYLDFQPVMHLSENRMTGVEALVRWQHPELGLLPPLQWIPLAEYNGSISDVGAWVLEEACHQLQRWDEQHPAHAPLGVAVNLSPRQLDEPGVVERLATVLLRTGVDPGRVVLEVTESALSTDTEKMIRRLEQLKMLGCQIAIDDFGTGFSSLSFLRRLPIDLIKIDKAFIDGIAEDPESRTILSAIVTLAHSLGKRVVAEGVEHDDQLAHLIALHCHYGQGFLFGEPVSASKISQALGVEAPQLVP